MTARMWRVAPVLLLLVAGCARGDVVAPAGTPTPEPIAFGGPVTVGFAGGSVEAEVASTSEQRQRGLMFRRSLGDDAGMIFLYAQAHQGGFWMKNTLIPLSIAYMRAEPGSTPPRLRVVSIRDMQPCRADPCPTYPPDQLYDTALEVNQGWFDGHGVRVGEVATVAGELPGPG